MALYLVQHGLANPKNEDEHPDDPGLCQKGEKEARLMAEVAKGYEVPVSVIQHSVKRRARRTARIFAKCLEPAKGTEERIGIKPMDDPDAVAKTLDPEENLMLVGHLPFMERLCALLITGRDAPPVFKFQNAGIVCLDKDEGDENWTIRWSLSPNIS